MIETVKPRKGNHAQVAYEQKFANKFKLVEHFPNYQALEAFAQKCVDYHIGDLLNGIIARVFIDKIIEMSNAKFITWAEKFQNNS